MKRQYGVTSDVQWRTAHTEYRLYVCQICYIHRRHLAAHPSHLPQRLSLRSWGASAVFAMQPIDATGGWQVTAGRGGP